MPKGRKARLKNFEKKAADFYTHFTKRGEYVSVERDYRTLRIGKGKHSRLAVKSKSHMGANIEIIRRFEKRVLQGEILPIHFAIVPAASSQKTGVQEYFNKPSLATLSKYFSGKLHNKENYFLCKQFARQNRKITLAKLEAIEKELKNYLQTAPSNVIVLGRNRDGRIRIAIVDL